MSTSIDKLRLQFPNKPDSFYRANAHVLDAPVKLRREDEDFPPRLSGPHGALLPVAAKKRIRQAQSDRRSQWERDYEVLLDMQWSHVYPQFILRLANGLVYKLDFLVVDTKGAHPRIEGHEVKGFARSTGIAKVKMAARLYPFIQFKLVTKRKKNMGWDVENVLP